MCILDVYVTYLLNSVQRRRLKMTLTETKTRGLVVSLERTPQDVRTRCSDRNFTRKCGGTLYQKRTGWLAG